MFTRLRGWTHAQGRAAILMLSLAALSGCAPAPDPMQTIRDRLFYDGLAAFHEGYYKEAALRWDRAAHFGDGEAARNLGHLYRQGLGVEQDSAIAVAWYQVAVEAGVVSAQYNLGMLYLTGGANVAADRSAAVRWLTKAAEAGIAPARQELERLASEPPKPKPEPVASAVVAEPPVAPVRVQIGSYQTRKAAEADLARLKRRSALGFEIVSGRDKDGQPWYRLMAVGTSDDVEAYCRQAATRRIGCWPHKSKVL